MVAEKSEKPVLVKWMVSRRTAALLIFFLIALLLEYAIVQSFIGLGVADSKAFTLTCPFATSISITVSPLFHLIPLGVIVVLMATWTYLAKRMAVRPTRMAVPRKPVQKSVKTQRLKTLRRFIKKVDDAITNGYGWLKNAVLKSRIATYLERKFGFAKIGVKTGLKVLLVFSALILLVTTLAYPRLIEYSVLGFLQWNTSFHGFILATHYGAQALGQALSPLGSLATAINSGLLAASPAIRSALAGFGTLTQPLVNLDPVAKYIVCQNLAAWLVGLLALAYGQFFAGISRFVRRR